MQKDWPVWALISAQIGILIGGLSLWEIGARAGWIEPECERLADDLASPVRERGKQRDHGPADLARVALRAADLRSFELGKKTRCGWLNRHSIVR